MSDTITGAAAALERGSTTSAALVETSLDAIAAHQLRTNAFTSVDAGGARDAARRADEERARGLTRGPLHGIPLSLKDLIDVAGQVTTAGSHVLDDRVAETSATLVRRLADAGAIVIGRTNLHEFAFGTTNEDSAFGAARHPLDPLRSPGGSSGGSAAAVATGMGLASIGTDTGGSVRIPAAICGLVGLKPTVGEIPTDGVIPLCPPFDHVGPLARRVQDAAWLYEVMAGRPVTTLAPMRAGAVRLGRLDGYFLDPLDPVVREAFDRAMARLTASGVTVAARGIAHASGIFDAYVTVVLPEAAACHDAYLDTRADRYTTGVRNRLLLGRNVGAVDYLKAREFCRTLAASVDRALEDCDALVLPTVPIVAPRLGEDIVVVDPGRDARLPVRTATLKLTQPFNMTGHPAISLPMASTGLPVGLQLVGRRGRTMDLLEIAAACESVLDAHEDHA